jgi:dihydropteroate synthase
VSRFVALLGSSRPLVMGVLNVTPDSFSDGGKFDSVSSALDRALQMISEKVDLIDVGGESTRPQADPITPQLELDRVIPVIKAIRQHSDVCLSIDTSTPDVMAAAAEVGVDLINDVRALARPGALKMAAQTGLPVCLVHMQGSPSTMQVNPQYADLIEEINRFFTSRIEACREAGIAKENIVLDPGFGFGKLPEHNLELVNRLDEFLVHGLPLLVGLSRKSTIAGIVDDRLVGSVAGAIMAVVHGAKFVRVHDVRETVDALKIVTAITTESLD